MGGEEGEIKGNAWADVGCMEGDDRKMGQVKRKQSKQKLKFCNKRIECGRNWNDDER